MLSETRLCACVQALHIENNARVMNGVHFTFASSSCGLKSLECVI